MKCFLERALREQQAWVAGSRGDAVRCAKPVTSVVRVALLNSWSARRPPSREAPHVVRRPQIARLIPWIRTDRSVGGSASAQSSGGPARCTGDARCRARSRARADDCPSGRRRPYARWDVGSAQSSAVPPHRWRLHQRRTHPGRSSPVLHITLRRSSRASRRRPRCTSPTTRAAECRSPTSAHGCRRCAE